MLRTGALSDPRVIELVNAEFVAVWVDVRTTPIPDVGALAQIKVPLDEHRMVPATAFNKSFLLQSIVMASDALTILNPDSAKWGLGLFPYGQTKADDYLSMLRGALERAPKSGQVPDRAGAAPSLP